jgi:hypothetical protein
MPEPPPLRNAARCCGTPHRKLAFCAAAESAAPGSCRAACNLACLRCCLPALPGGGPTRRETLLASLAGKLVGAGGPGTADEKEKEAELRLQARARPCPGPVRSPVRGAEQRPPPPGSRRRRP